MFAKKNISIPIIVLAVLCVVAFAYQASAYISGSGDSTPYIYSGKIVAIDNANGFITVQAGPDNELSFDLSHGALVTKCGTSIAFDNLKVGEWVKVSYFEEGTGPNMAASVDYLPAGNMEHC